MLPHFDGCVNLLAAIGRQWLRDALLGRDDLVELAEWLSTTTDALRAQVADPAGPHAAYNPAIPRICPTCGAPLPAYNSTRTGQGRRRMYCTRECSQAKVATARPRPPRR